MEGGGVRVRAEPSRRPRFTPLNQMSTIAADGRDLSGLTLEDILNSQKRTSSDAAAVHPPPPPPPPPLRPSTPGRTLLDIIRDEDPKTTSFKGFGSRDKKAWRSFKDRLRLRRSGSGAAWTSSLHVPTSDILIPTSRSLVARRNSVRSLFTDSSSSPPPRRSLEMVMMSQPGEYDSDNDISNTAAAGGGVARPQITRRSSSRFGANATVSDNDDHSDAGSDNSPSPRRRGGFHQAGPSLRPQISRRHSTRFATAMDDTVTDQTEPPPPQRDGTRRLSAVLAEERSLSAREAVAAQEAAEAAAVAATEDSEVPAVEGAAAPPVRMSLMDLLEETDRQMGFVGSRYVIGEEDDEDEYEEEEVEEIAGAGAGRMAEQNCCVCMIRHKGAAFIPCGHTFCRLCSRELWVSRGNCPLCNGFILEILDIF